MYHDMSKAEKEDFKQKLYEQFNYGRLRQMEKSLKLLHVFFWGTVTLTVVFAVITAFLIPSLASIVTVMLCILFLMWTLIFIKPYRESLKTIKKALNDFIMEISNSKMNYDEYKVYKNQLH